MDEVMNLYFCDLCNESIPQADLDLGRAVRRNERLICAACEGAMSGGHARPDGAAAAPPLPPAPRPSTTAASSSVVAVGLAFSAVALVLSVGGSAYLYTLFEQHTATWKEELVQRERAAGEQARTVTAALVAEKNEREAALERLRQESQALSQSIAELTKMAERGAALAPRLDKLDERLTSVDDLASRVEHQAGTLDALTATVARLATEGARPKESAKTASDAPPEKPAVPAPAAAPAAPSVATWQNWVADLASQNSGTRWQAVQSLGGTGDAAVVSHLVPMLKDADIFVRMAASRILGDLGSVEAIPALIDALEDEEASVREAALVSLRGLSSQSIPFDPLARDGDRSKRVKAWRDWWEQASKELSAAGKSKPKG